jgi:CRP-like cAMP-binding protein
VLATLGVGGFFGDMALLREGSRGSTIIAKETTACLVLQRDDYQRRLQEKAP